jgi:hypothetical protein
MGKTLWACLWQEGLGESGPDIVSCIFKNLVWYKYIYKIIGNTCGTTWMDSFGTIYNQMYVTHIYIYSTKKKPSVWYHGPYYYYPNTSLKTFGQNIHSLRNPQVCVCMCVIVPILFSRRYTRRVVFRASSLGVGQRGFFHQINSLDTDIRTFFCTYDCWEVST